MVFIGNVNSPKGIKYAGSIHAEDDNWIEKEERVSKNSILRCPNCRKIIMPLRSKNIKARGTRFPWAGTEYQNIEDVYTSICPKCKNEYEFGILFLQ